MPGMTRNGHSLLLAIIATHILFIAAIYYFPDEKVAAIVNGARTSVAAAIVSMYIFPSFNMFQRDALTRSGLLATGIVLAAASQLVAGACTVVAQIFGHEWVPPALVAWFSMLAVFGGICHIIAPRYERGAQIDVWYAPGLWVGVGVGTVIAIMIVSYLW